MSESLSINKIIEILKDIRLQTGITIDDTSENHLFGINSNASYPIVVNMCLL